MNLSKIPIYDIVKSIALITIFVIAYHYFTNYIESSNKANQVAQELIIQKYTAELKNITANNDNVKMLLESFEKRESKILAIFEKNKATTGEVLDEIASIKAESKQTRKLIDNISQKSYDHPTKNDMDYEFVKIYSKDAEKKEYPVAWAMYFPNRDTEKRWKTGTYPLEYHTDVIESENKDATFNRYAEMYVENNQMKETKGQEFPLKVTDIKWTKIERKLKSFSWWNPRVSLSVNSSTSEIFPALNLSLMSYGKTNVDMDFKFLSFGAGGSGSSDNFTGYCLFEPLSWNLGQRLPLIKNLFVGPIVTINTDSKVQYGLSGSIPF